MERHSPGLEQFFASVRGEENLYVLDLAGANQSTISFITGLGHRLYAEDFLQSLDAQFGGGADCYEEQARPGGAAWFERNCFDFPPAELDGALVWDALEFLAPPLLNLAISRLHRVLKPGAYMLAFFHADEKAREVPSYSFRITNTGTNLLVPRGMRRPAQFFNNRALERMFQHFASVKFFLTRDHLREVIVRR